MTLVRLAISIDAALARAIRRAAGRKPMAAWLADAAVRKLRADGLLDAVARWEREHHALNDAELELAARRHRRRRR